MKKQRLFYLDLIRAVALVCILVIHFNAAVTGYFTLPSKLFGSVLPFNIYLGDFGSSLFFMVSGAALQYTSPGQGREPLNLARFYQKRAKAVYPMFWLAWCIFFPIRFAFFRENSNFLRHSSVPSQNVAASITLLLFIKV